MKHRLRVLLVLFISLLALLGTRVEYLRRCAAFHQNEARRFAEMIGTQRNITRVEVDAALEVAAASPDDYRLDHKFHVVFHHRAAADAYREAVSHPWTIVHEPPLPEQHYDD